MNNFTISVQVQCYTSMYTISRFYLLISGPPDSPQNVSAINVTSNSVVLRWLNPVSAEVPAAFVRFSIELATTSN